MRCSATRAGSDAASPTSCSTAPEIGWFWRRCTRHMATARRQNREMSDKVATLQDAVAGHVRAGDAIHMLVGHTRWTAAAREVVRQWWGEDPRFTLVMLSLSSLGTLFFRGGLVDRVVTGYSGDTFPNFTPNPWFQKGYRSGDVEVEHWSFLAFTQRLEAAA